MSATFAWFSCCAALALSQILGGGLWAVNLVYAPVVLVLPFVLTRRDPRPDPLGLSAGHLASDLGLAGLLSVLILGPWLLWTGPPVPGAGALLTALLVNLLGVALPEELFFRGYLQPAWDRLHPGRLRLLGAELGPGALLATGAFALTHVLSQGAPGLLTFFPGLVFAWTRARTGTLWAGLVFHALCNVAARPGGA